MSNVEKVKLELETALEEYRFIREEMLHRQKQRTDMSYILLLSTATLYAAAVTSKTHWLLMFPPWILIILMFQIYQSYRLHEVHKKRALEIENFVDALLHKIGYGGNNHLFWLQHHYEEAVKKKEVPPLLREASYVIMLWVLIFISCPTPFLMSNEQFWIATSINLATIVSGLLTTIYFLRLEKKTKFGQIIDNYVRKIKKLFRLEN